MNEVPVIFMIFPPWHIFLDWDMTTFMDFYPFPVYIIYCILTFLVVTG